MVGKVNVGTAWGELVGDVRQRQIVRRHQADRARIDQAADEGLGSVPAVVGIRTGEDLVEKE